MQHIGSSIYFTRVFFLAFEVWEIRLKNKTWTECFLCSSGSSTSKSEMNGLRLFLGTDFECLDELTIVKILDEL